MKFSFLKRWKFWKRFLLLTIALPILLFGILLLIVYLKQDDLIQGEIEACDTFLSRFIHQFIAELVMHFLVFEGSFKLLF